MGKAIILEGFDFQTKKIGTVTIREDVSLQSLSINAETPYTGMYLQCRVIYTPLNTNQTGVTWSIISGGEYATINSNGLITIDSSADGEDIRVKCVSTVDENIYAEKTINVTYEHQSDYLTSIAITGNATVVLSEAQYDVTYDPSDTYMKGVEWSVISGGDYATINSSTGKLTIKPNANESEVIIKAASIYDSSKYATKTLTLTYLDAIVFADPNMKAACIAAGWDTDNNGEISRLEAEAVTYVAGFKNNTNIVSFDEFKYFSNVTSMGQYPFQGCTSLVSITLPSSLTSIASSRGFTFDGCTSLKKINLQNITTYVVNNNCYIFNNCSNLEDIGGNLNDSVTVIGTNCFNGCSKMPLTALPSSLTTIGGNAFYNCTKVTISTIPSSVTSIGEKAFWNCTGIVTLDMSGCTGALSISSSAFRYCTNLQVVKLPATLSSLGGNTFANCKTGLKIVCYATTPPTCGTTILNATTSPAIYVPDTSVDTYKATSGWSTYASNIHPISEYTE